MVLTSVEVIVQGIKRYYWLHVGETHIYPCIFVMSLNHFVKPQTLGSLFSARYDYMEK